ncbi:hypothetical protein AMJ80_11095 [bacterium SM23_31]|nr:MAG: hypothetical protein AMJ80_11095 [bacterium SM23_31]
MSGIVFFGTNNLMDLKDFYEIRVGCEVWLDQGDRIIFKKGNLLFGFSEQDEVDKEGIITFFYNNKEEVDRIYEKFKATAVSPPSIDEKYRIYHFFTNDPEGRKLEFQYFDHPVNRYLSGDDLLMKRRSIRNFIQTEIPEEILDQIFEVSRFAPTSRNSQSYYFKLIRDKETIDWLSKRRGENSAPIGMAPMAVAVCSDPGLSKRYVQDGCIAAYHFILSAWFLGLGTCWIAAMDREDVKKMLPIPEHHYVATITPLGFPESIPLDPPERKERDWFVRK